VYTKDAVLHRRVARKPTSFLGRACGPPVAWLLHMSKNTTTKKLEINKLTIHKLTADEVEGAVGGIAGVVLNPTGGDTRGVKLSVQWYAAKWTIGGGK